MFNLLLLFEREKRNFFLKDVTKVERVWKGLKIGLANLDLAIRTFVYKNGRYLLGERGNHLV